MGRSGDGSRREMEGNLLSLSTEDETGVVDVNSELRRPRRIGDEDRSPPNTSVVMESRRKSFSGEGGVMYCEVPYSDVGRALTGVELSGGEVWLRVGRKLGVFHGGSIGSLLLSFIIESKSIDLREREVGGGEGLVGSSVIA